MLGEKGEKGVWGSGMLLGVKFLEIGGWGVLVGFCDQGEVFGYQHVFFCRGIPERFWHVMSLVQQVLMKRFARDSRLSSNHSCMPAQKNYSELPVGHSLFRKTAQKQDIP